MQQLLAPPPPPKPPSLDVPLPAAPPTPPLTNARPPVPYDEVVPFPLKPPPPEPQPAPPPSPAPSVRTASADEPQLLHHAQPPPATINGVLSDLATNVPPPPPLDLPLCPIMIFKTQF